jgi:aminopeptidase N
MLAAMSRQAAYDAEPGSSLQLTWARIFALSARTADHLELLRAWLNGSDLPQDLAVDAELRWLILHGLVASGAADGDEVEREFAADTSVGGRRGAATARALIPTAEAKERAWRLILEHNDSADVRLATLIGFGHPAHVGVTGPYVARYFAVLDEVWREQGTEIGRYFAILCFPKAHISAETLAAADAWRAGEGHSPALVRLVTEGRDTMARAMAARARDAAPTDPAKRGMAVETS